MAKLKTQLIGVFLLVGLLPVITVGIMSFTMTQNELHNQIGFQLDSAAHMRVEHIMAVLGNFKESIEIAATHQDLSNEELRQIRNINTGFHEVFVLDGEGVVVASSDVGRSLGKDFSTELFFLNGKKKTYLSDVQFDYDIREHNMIVSTPFHEGVLTARVKMEILNTILTDREKWGLTGETYLVNKDFLMISPSRFQPDDVTILKQEVDTMNSRTCFQYADQRDFGGRSYGHGEEVLTFLDYRAVPVVGVHRYIPELDWCLLAEFDEAEAFQSISSTRIRIFTVTIVFTLLILLAALLYGGYVTRPIKNLTKEVDTISKGKLDVQLSMSNVQEVQSLTDSLSRVLASMKLAILRTGIRVDGELGSREKLVDTPKEAKLKSGKKRTVKKRAKKTARTPSGKDLDGMHKEKRQREGGEVWEDELQSAVKSRKRVRKK